MKKSTSAQPRWRPRLRHCKSKGEWAEVEFMSRAIGLGFIVCRPFGDNHRFDFVVISDSGSVHRIQVKSSWTMLKRAYFLNTHGSNSRRYRSAETDFIVGYVVPEGAWYVIPIGAVPQTMIALFPHVPRSRGRFEPYREAWELLRTPQSPDAKLLGPDLLPFPSLLDFCPLTCRCVTLW